MPLIGSQFATDLMFLPVVMDRFLHIACPFSYKRMFTTKRIAIIISGLWLLSIAFGLLGLVGKVFAVDAESRTCPRGVAFRLFGLVILGMLSYYICTCV